MVDDVRTQDQQRRRQSKAPPLIAIPIVNRIPSGYPRSDSLSPRSSISAGSRAMDMARRVPT